MIEIIIFIVAIMNLAVALILPKLLYAQIVQSVIALGLIIITLVRMWKSRK